VRRGEARAAAEQDFLDEFARMNAAMCKAEDKAAAAARHAANKAAAEEKKRAQIDAAEAHFLAEQEKLRAQKVKAQVS
jgi:hypothetical protein